MVDGTKAPGGIDGDGIQIGNQLASICAITAYSFTSPACCFLMKYTPGLHLRVSEEVELNGLDGDHFFEERLENGLSLKGMSSLLGCRRLRVSMASEPALVVGARMRRLSVTLLF